MSVTAPTTGGERGFRARLADHRPPAFRDYAVYLGLVLVIACFAVALPNSAFLSQGNFEGILRAGAITIIMAVGVVFVLSAAEMDLSIGSILALAAITSAKVMDSHGPVAGALGGVAVGGCAGLVNGLLTTKLRVPSFLVTLGMMQVLSGLARSISDLQAIPVSSDGFQKVFGQGHIGPLSSLFLWTAGAVLVGHLLLRNTPFGRHVLATGGNRNAAEFSGLRTDGVRIKVLVISGLAAGLAGVISTGQLGSARYDLGANDLLTVLAAVVIGGTSLFGGRGSVIGAVAGALLIVTLENGLILANISPSDQLTAQGVIIIAAIALSVREAGSAGGASALERLRARWRARARADG